MAFGPLALSKLRSDAMSSACMQVTAVAHVPLAGRYWAHLNLHGDPIGSSPYLLTVRAAAASAGASALWGEGLHRAVAGLPAYFAIQLKDALGNATALGAHEVTARVASPSNNAARMALPHSPTAAKVAAAAAQAEADGAVVVNGLGADYVGEAPPPPSDGASEVATAAGGVDTPECSIYHAYDQQGGGGGAGKASGGEGNAGPGMLSGVWRTLTAGRHYLHLQLRGEPLPGSPFPITVLGGHTHAASSTLYLQGGATRTIRPGELLLFQILARDRWGNLRGESGDDFHVHVRGGARPTTQEVCF